MEKLQKIVELKRKSCPPPASLSSWIVTTLAMAYSAELNDLLAYVEWSVEYQPMAYSDDPAAKALHGNNVWDWYFEQPHSVASDTKRDETWYWGTPVPAYRLDDRFNLGQIYCSRGKSVIPRLFRPNEVVKAYADRLLDKCGLTPDNTIAVSYRGTDLGTDGRHATPLSNFFPVVDTLIARYPMYKVWVQTDDAYAKDALQSKFPKSVFVNDFVTSYRKDTFSDNASPKYGYERGLDVAAMILMLSRCKVLVKNSCNLAVIASHLSEGEVIDVV
jgi:hypothetical protein